MKLYSRNYIFFGNEGTEAEDDAMEQGVQQDWSVVWNYFDNPHQLLTTPGTLPKGMQELVRNAVSEMRRYYSRKIVDVLIKVTRISLDAIRKRFIRVVDSGNATNKKFPLSPPILNINP